MKSACPRAPALAPARPQKRANPGCRTDCCGRRRVGVDRNQVVRTVHLHAVAGVIEQSDVGALQFRSKLLNSLVEAGLVEIKLRAVTYQPETEQAQGVRH